MRDKIKLKKGISKEKESTELMKVFTTVGYVGFFSWVIAWGILVFSVDFTLYLALLFYGLGLSGITIMVTFLLIFKVLKSKGILK